MLRNKYKIGRESLEDTDIVENPVEVESDVNTADAVDPETLPVEDLLHYEEDMATIQKLDFDISQVVDAADEGNELAKEVTEGLERAADLVAGKAENDPIDAIATQESLKYLFKRAGLEYNPSKFNLEDATSNLQLANSINLEFFKELATGIKEGAVKVYEYLVELLTKLWKYISGIFYKEGKKYLDIKVYNNGAAAYVDLTGKGDFLKGEKSLKVENYVRMLAISKSLTDGIANYTLLTGIGGIVAVIRKGLTDIEKADEANSKNIVYSFNKNLVDSFDAVFREHYNVISNFIYPEYQQEVNSLINKMGKGKDEKVFYIGYSNTTGETLAVYTMEIVYVGKDRDETGVATIVIRNYNIDSPRLKDNTNTQLVLERAGEALRKLNNVADTIKYGESTVNEFRNVSKVFRDYVKTLSTVRTDPILLGVSNSVNNMLTNLVNLTRVICANGMAERDFFKEISEVDVIINTKR